MTVDEAITIVENRGKGRTRYEGQEPWVDEVLVAEIMRLRAKVAEMGWYYENTRLNADDSSRYQ